MMNFQKKKSLLFPIEDFSTGGVMAFVDQYTSFLRTSEFEVIVVGFQNETERDERLFQDCVIINVPKSGISFKIARRFIDSIRFATTVTKVLQKYNVVQIHFGTTKSTLMTLLSPLSWSKKKTGTFYGDWANEVLSFRSTFLDRTIDFAKRRCIQTVTLHLLSRVIVFSEYAKKLLMKDHKISEKNIIILPGASMEKHIDISKTYSPKNLKLLNISRLDPRKGHANLLRAMELLKGYVDMELIIAGPFKNSEIYNLIHLYDELKLFMNVRFIHGVNSRMKEKLYRWADLFVMPSVSLETFGVTIIESLSYGVPVIGTNIGAIPEILNKIDSRLIIPGTKPKEIMSKIRWYYLLKNQEKKKLRNKCIEVMKSDYSFETIRNKFIEEMVFH